MSEKASEEKLRELVAGISNLQMAPMSITMPHMPILGMETIDPKSLVPSTNLVTENIKANRASEFYNQLTTFINEFNDSLDNNHEVGVRLVNFGQSIVFHLKTLGFLNPSLIRFGGHTEGGDPVELIQHVSQISVLLMKMTRTNPDEPKRHFGFHVEKSAVEQQQ